MSCSFHFKQISLKLLFFHPDPPVQRRLHSSFFSLTSHTEKSKHGKNEGKKRSVSTVTFKQPIWRFIYFFPPLSFFFFFIGIKVQGWQNVQSAQDQRRALCFSEWWGWDWIQRVSSCQTASRLSFLAISRRLSFSFPLFFLSSAVLLYMLTISHFISSPPLFLCWLALTLCQSFVFYVASYLSSLARVASLTILRPFIYPSSLPVTVIIHLLESFIPLFFLFTSLPAPLTSSTRASVSPSVSFIPHRGPRGWWLF